MDRDIAYGLPGPHQLRPRPEPPRFAGDRHFLEGTELAENGVSGGSVGVMVRTVTDHQWSVTATGPYCPDQSGHTDSDFGPVRKEIGVLRRDFTTDVVALRDEIGVLRRDIGDLHTEVAALRGDVAGVRGNAGETGVPRDWWATAGEIDEFFGSVPEAEREGVEVGQEEPEEAGMLGMEVGPEVPEEAEIEGVEGGTGVAEEVFEVMRMQEQTRLAELAAEKANFKAIHAHGDIASV
ncbi:Hypothetical predicted protein [Olea europaea subsp. europaea]|uniref:Uncharacterized protein n=1 Tax=Olea europaea subsp. europaea TaxID=158383 RepID=A0A8S0V115_OLEEU|nr:Hypothetical predicted protein [Olea europaea subsp. europaea]